MSTITEKQPNEVAVEQYLRPDGKKTITFAPIGEDYVLRAKNMIFSAEVLTTNEVVVYGKKKGQSEEQEISEIATNGPGKKSPVNCLRRIINRLEKT